MTGFKLVVMLERMKSDFAHFGGEKKIGADRHHRRNFEISCNCSLPLFVTEQ